MVLVLRVGPATRLLVGVRSGKVAAIDLHALDFEEAIDPVRSSSRAKGINPGPAARFRSVIAVSAWDTTPAP